MADRLLTDLERGAVEKLESAGLIRRLDDGRIEVTRDDSRYPEVAALLEELARSPESEVEEVERLRTAHREATEMLGFVQELNRTILASASLAELYGRAFSFVSDLLEFDIGVAVMLEQNLDLYLSTRENLERAADDRLLAKIRESLQNVIPVSFSETDAVVKSHAANLPLREVADPLQHHIGVVVRQDERITGIVAFFREGEPFGEDEQRLLEVLSTQVAMVLGKIRAQERIQKLADTDDLTGVWNRRVFRQRLSSEIDRCKTYGVTLSIMMVDLDNFKEINDGYGHGMGDVVLSEMCGTIRETLRPPDTLARLGGDEFAVILPHTDLPGARSVAERMVERVREVAIPTESGASVGCTVSVGVAVFVPPDMTAAELIQRADDRLYVSKNDGKNRASW